MLHCLLFSTSLLFCMAEESVIPLLASRLVGPGALFVTQPISDLLLETRTPVDDYKLTTVAQATQEAWVRPDWKFTDADIKDSVDIAAARRLVDSLFVERMGTFSPHVLCQGGGLGTMLQTCAALCKVMHEFPVSKVTCAYRSLPVHFSEPKVEDYQAVLRVLGQKSEGFDTKPTTFPELVAFFKTAYPILNTVPIEYIPVEEDAILKQWKEEHKGQRFCVVAAPLQAAASVQSLQATFSDVTLTGVQTIGSKGAEMCEPLYGDTTTPKQQLAVRLHHIGRELFFINKNVETHQYN